MCLRDRTSRRLFAPLKAAVLALLLMGAPMLARAEAGKVALTFDDLPGLSLVQDQPYVNYLNVMLLRGLKRHRLPAIGFVNESKLDQCVGRV